MDLEMIRIYLNEAREGTIHGSFARQRADASLKKIDRVIDELRDAHGRSF